MGLLSFIGGVVVVFWILGVIFKIGGGLIHLLLIVAVIAFVYDLVFKRRTRVK